MPLLFLLFTGAWGQKVPDSLIVKIDSLNNSLDIEHQAFLFIDSAEHFEVNNIPDSKFVSLSGYTHKQDIPNNLLPFPLYLKFTLKNISNAQQIYSFFPGMYYKSISIYKQSEHELKALNTDETASGFVDILLKAGEQTTFIVKLKFAKTEYNKINAVIIKRDFLPNYILQLSYAYRDKRIASYVLCGALLMMIIFTLVNYFLSYKREFLYHAAFSTCMFLLIFFTSYLTKRPGAFTALFSGYIDLILLIVGTIFYLSFVRRFLDTKTKHSRLDKLFKIETWILIILMFVFTYLYFETNNILLGNIIENTMKIVALAIGTVFIIKGLKHKDRLMQYMAMGSAAQIFFSIISLFIILSGIGASSILSSALFYFEIGIIMAIFFFLLGLTYKNRRDLVEKTQEQEATKLEVEKKVFETKLAVINAQQEERNRISADMHDDLGSGMTTIRLFSELAKTKMGDSVIPEIEKISASADELLNKMNAIIWSMSSSNDSLGNMVAYIRSYSLEYFENTGIDVKVTIPENLPELEVSGEIRRNIFLVVKEALNNIVKHAGATEVKLIMQVEEKGLSLLIKDNGKGIDFTKLRQFGNGLKNMKKRMSDVGIEFHIDNDEGTTVKLYKEI